LNLTNARGPFLAAGLLPLVLLATFIPAAQAQDKDGDDDDDDLRPSSAPAEIVITARLLDAGRAEIEPALGASSYTLSNDALEHRPAGETASIAQVLLQTPGVAQIGKGEISLRGSQAGIQYRINNIILPEGIADLGEQLSPRLAEKIQLITGALPAQYGLQVGGVINITTKNGLYGEGSQFELYGGGHGQVEPAIEFAGASGSTSYFGTGSYLHDSVGLASPDGSAKPKHDSTDQFEGLTFIDHVIDDASRVSLIAGLSDEHFEIPENSALDLDDPSTSTTANPVYGGRLHQQSIYGALSYLHSSPGATLQFSVSGRGSHDALRPGASAGLFQTGLGGKTSDNTWSLSVQAEGAFQLGERHTLRAGGVGSFNRLHSRLDAMVLTLGNAPVLPSATTSFDYVQRNDASLFVQDEWKATDRLTFNFGGRLDSISGFIEGTSLSPRASLVWSGPSGLTLHGGYARYFVAPSLLPVGHAGMLEATSALPSGGTGDPIKLETDDYYDVGGQQKIGVLTLGIDAFWREAQNFLSEFQDGSPLLAKPFNYRKARIRGVEVSATYADGPISAWVNLALTDAKANDIISGQGYFAPGVVAYVQSHWVQPDGAQRVSASAGATYALGALHLSTELLYGSGLPRTPSTSNPSAPNLPNYAQVNFAATFGIMGLRGRPLDLRLDVINALDAPYQISEESKAGTPQWAPRRAVFVGLEQAF
jgi:outer membrane receptor protein involved in Fe transport